MKRWVKIILFILVILIFVFVIKFLNRSSENFLHIHHHDDTLTFNLTNINNRVAGQIEDSDKMQLMVYYEDKLDAKDAEKLAKFKWSIISLWNLSWIESDAVEALYEFGWDIYLNKLKDIDADAMKKIVEINNNSIKSGHSMLGFKKWWIFFHIDLLTLTPDVAKELGNLDSGYGVLILDNLQIISAEAVSWLVQYQWSVNLNWIKDLSVDVASEIWKASRDFLDLWITNLDVDVARWLSNFNWKGIEISWIKEISTEALRELANFDWWWIKLDWLSEINVEQAKELAKFKSTSWLNLDWLNRIDKDVARELIKYKGPTIFLGVHYIDNDTAKILAEFWWNIDVRWMAYDQLEEARKSVIITADVAQRFIDWELGTLNNFWWITAEWAKILATYTWTELNLNWLTSIDADSARELAKFSSETSSKWNGFIVSVWNRINLKWILEIDIDSLSELIKYEWNLNLWLKNIDDVELAKILTKWKWVTLDNLNKISPEVAQVFAKERKWDQKKLEYLVY